MMLKDHIKKIMPASNSQVDEMYERLMQENEELKKALNNVVSLLEEEKCKFDNVFKIKNEIYTLHRDVSDIKREVHNIYIKTGVVKDDIYTSRKKLELIEKNVQPIRNAINEAIWGLVFNDAIRQSEWLKIQKFYPGRWAVGYQYLYVLYRILNGIKPCNILELGLGQSTCMITQYVENTKKVTHRVVEHDPEWITFFKKENSLCENSSIIQLDITEKPYKDDIGVLMYEGFYEKLSDQKYDFISIDAPFGGQAKKYARVDTLALIPNCLADSFVIMIDDVNRKGEQNTVDLLKQKLEENKIEFSYGYYVGNKTTFVIASIDKKFVCTM